MEKIYVELGHDIEPDHRVFALYHARYQEIVTQGQTAFDEKPLASLSDGLVSSNDPRPDASDARSLMPAIHS